MRQPVEVSLVSVRRIYLANGTERLQRWEPEAPPSCAEPASGRSQTELQTALVRTPVASVMTREVACVEPELSLEALHLVLVDERISGVPVVDADGRLQGIVSQTDLVFAGYDRAEALDEARRNERLYGESAAPSMDSETPTRVSEVMTRSPIAIRECASIAEASAVMSRAGIHRLPVVDGDQRVVGILSPLDVMRWLAEHAGVSTRP